MSKRKFWNFIKNESKNSGELQLYGEISDSSWWGDEVTPKNFKADLDSLGDIDVLNVYINSPGGDVFAGQAIHTMLKRHSATVNVYIDGLAASIASVIAMAGDKVVIPSNAMIMIHNAWTWGMGNAQDFRKLADDMDKINASIKSTYLAKAKNIDEEKLTELMDSETWLTAQEAVDYGFADEIEESREIVAFIPSKFKNSYKRVPKNLSDSVNYPNDASSPAFNVGDRISLTIPPHMEGHSTGEIREAVLTWTYGIIFDGMEDMGIHHWYVESEIQEESSESSINEDSNEPQDKKKKKMPDMPGMENNKELELSKAKLALEMAL